MSIIIKNIQDETQLPDISDDHVILYYHNDNLYIKTNLDTKQLGYQNDTFAQESDYITTEHVIVSRYIKVGTTVSNSTLSKNYTLTIGNQNINNGDYTYVHGDNLQINNSNYSLAFGYNNKLSNSNYSLVFGKNNTINVTTQIDTANDINSNIILGGLGNSISNNSNYNTIINSKNYQISNSNNVSIINSISINNTIDNNSSIYINNSNTINISNSKFSTVINSDRNTITRINGYIENILLLNTSGTTINNYNTSQIISNITKYIDVIGGISNTIYINIGSYNSILNSNFNTIQGISAITNNIILNSESNTINNTSYTSIINSYSNNIVNSKYISIINSKSSSLNNSSNSIVLNAVLSSISSTVFNQSNTYNNIIGGYDHNILTTSNNSTISFSLILNGYRNNITNNTALLNNCNTIINGDTNYIRNTKNSIILNGYNNTIFSSKYSSIISSPNSLFAYGNSSKNGFSYNILPTDVADINYSHIIGGGDNLLLNSIKNTTIYTNNLLLNTSGSSIINSNYTTIIGGLNNRIISGNTVYIIGSNNNFAGSNSIPKTDLLILGSNNIQNNKLGYTHFSNKIIGNYNELFSNNISIINFNTSNNFISGNYNKLVGSENYIIGNYNTTGSFSNFIMGNYNSAITNSSSPAYNYIIGYNNILTGSTISNTAIFGNNNKTSHKKIMIFGDDIVTSGTTFDLFNNSKFDDINPAKNKSANYAIKNNIGKTNYFMNGNLHLMNSSIIFDGYYTSPGNIVGPLGIQSNTPVTYNDPFLRDKLYIYPHYFYGNSSIEFMFITDSGSVKKASISLS